VLLRVSEIFKSLQGEGPLLGRPAVFLRLAGCNLSCIWCDTVYARGYGTVMHVDDLSDRLTQLLLSIDQDKPLLVVTGGEPLLQAESLCALLSEIKRRLDLEIQIETNGTISPKPLLDLVDYIVVSPKLSNSGNPPEARRLHPDWKSLAKSDRPVVYFKFVIDSPEDINEVLSIIESFQIPKSRVFLMPQCRNVEEQLSKLRWISELALKFSLNVTPRLQYLAGIK